MRPAGVEAQELSQGIESMIGPGAVPPRQGERVDDLVPGEGRAEAPELAAEEARIK